MRSGARCTVITVWTHLDGLPIFKATDIHYCPETMRRHLLLAGLMMLSGWTARAQQMPCPFEYPDTPVNRSRCVVGCTLQCDQKLTFSGQQPTDPQKTRPA